MIEFEDVKLSRKRKVCIGTNANPREYQFQIRYKETTINGKRYNGKVWEVSCTRNGNVKSTWEI